MSKISLYKNLTDKKQERDIGISEYVTIIQNGINQDDVIKARAMKQRGDIAGYKEIKAKQPIVTASCVMNGKSKGKADILEMNGFIVVDIDDEIDNETFDRLSADIYTKIVHRSFGGDGVCIFVRIDTNRFLDSFRGLQIYYLEKYQITIDQSCSNPNRLRYISYDPGLIENEKSQTFKKYPRKEKIKEPQIIVVKSDFESLVAQIQQRGIDLAGDNYERFLRIGFSIASEFGEGGRDYFHAITSNGIKYNQKVADRQFSHCVSSGGNGIGIGTLYYYAADAGIEIYSKETTNIIRKASQVKRRGIISVNNDDEIHSEFNKYAQMGTSGFSDTKENRQVWEKVVKSPQNMEKALKSPNDSETGRLREFIHSEFPMRLNEYTNKKELLNGEQVDDRILNHIWIETDISLEFDVSQSKVRAILDNTDVETFNPLREFISNNKDIQTDNETNRLIETLSVDGDIERRVVIKQMVKKWFVSMFTVLENKYSPLVLVLQGAQGDGKSHWLEYLLPEELKRYFAMSEFNGTKDDLSAMHKCLLIVNDEFGGQTIKDSQKFKEMVSKNTVFYRPPYAREEKEFKRIALFAGTTNEESFLNDSTGNRRIIPVRLKPNDKWTDGDGWKYSINQKEFNGINKTALIIDAYNTYKAGFNVQILRDEIGTLEDNTKDFELHTEEQENILKYCTIDQTSGKTSTEVKNLLSMLPGVSQSLGTKRIGHALRSLGYECSKSGGRRCWNVRVKHEDETNESTMNPPGSMPWIDDIPI